MPSRPRLPFLLFSGHIAPLFSGVQHHRAPFHPRCYLLSSAVWLLASGLVVSLLSMSCMLRAEVAEVRRSLVLGVAGAGAGRRRSSGTRSRAPSIIAFCSLCAGPLLSYYHYYGSDVHSSFCARARCLCSVCIINVNHAYQSCPFSHPVRVSRLAGTGPTTRAKTVDPVPFRARLGTGKVSRLCDRREP